MKKKNLLTLFLYAFAFLMCRLSTLSAQNDLAFSDIQSTEAPTQTAKLGFTGFISASFSNVYITPRGMLFNNSDLAATVLTGFNLKVYHEPKGFINDVDFTVQLLFDIWTGQDNRYVGAWREFDWFFGTVITFCHDWKFGVQYIQFLGPNQTFRLVNNVEFLLAYDDSKFKLPVVFYPYVKLWWTVSGDSTVAVGRRGHTYDVEIGFVPTVKIEKWCVPMTFTFPTWITVGPQSFWNGGKLALKHEKKNFGVFSTGFMDTIPLKFIKPVYGNWYVNFGFQYYYLINRNLMEGQKYTLGFNSIHRAHRNIGQVYATLGVNW